MTTDQTDAAAILSFWLMESRPKQWFRQSDAFDQAIRQRFGGQCAKGQKGHLDHWAHHRDGSLALVLLLDQFSRHVWRGSAQAFAGDGKAVALSLQAVANGWLNQEPERVRRQFWLMPLLHSEELDVQDQAVELMQRYADRATAAIAKRHRAVIAQFGRFPHRNGVLNRQNSAEEIRFLSRHQPVTPRPSSVAPADPLPMPTADPPA